MNQHPQFLPKLIHFSDAGLKPDAGSTLDSSTATPDAFGTPDASATLDVSAKPDQDTTGGSGGDDDGCRVDGGAGRADASPLLLLLALAMARRRRDLKTGVDPSVDLKRHDDTK